MSDTETSQNLSMLCLGSPIEPLLLHQLRTMKKPDVPGVLWTQPRNLFIAHQDFFKMKPNYDLNKLMATMRTEILYKYFPMILKPRDLHFLWNSRSMPKSLDWNLAVSSIRDTRLDLHQMRAMINKEMETILKDPCYSYQSIKFDPSIRLARISPDAKDNPELRNLELIKMPLTDENVVISQLMFVKVTKDEFGLNYEYIPVDEYG